jgi:hypothetical protein
MGAPHHRQKIFVVGGVPDGVVPLSEGVLVLAILSRARKKADIRSSMMPNATTPEAPADPVV